MDNLLPKYSITVRSAPNIALIKYWGKSNLDLNIPLNSSLSITLDQNTRIYSVESSNLLAAAIYTVTTTCLTPLGVDTGTSFDF